MKEQPKHPTEGELQRMIVLYLRWRGYVAFRVNNGATYDPALGIYRRPTPIHMRGVSDIVAIDKTGRAIFIEVKSHRGQVSDDQLVFLDVVRKQGAVGILARCLKDVQDALGL